MAATLDDLVYLHTATRIGLFSFLEIIERHLDAMASYLTGEPSSQSPNPLPANSGSPAASPSAFTRPIPVIIVGPKPLPVSGTGGSPQATPPPAPSAPSRGGNAWEGLTTGPSKIIGLFGAVERAITSFGGAVSRFVEKASPVTIMRWQMAVNDATAVVGKALIPIMERMTAAVRVVGDAFLNLSGEAKKLLTGFALGAGLGGTLAAMATAGAAFLRVFGGIPILIGTLVGSFIGAAAAMDSGRAIFSAFKSAISALTGLIETLASAIAPIAESILVPVMESFAKGLNKLSAALGQMVNDIRQMVGLEQTGGSKSSVGASVRNAQIGDIQGYINRAYTSAFTAGLNKDDHGKQTVTELKGIRAILDKGMGEGLWANRDSWASVRRHTEDAGRAIGGDEGAAVGKWAGRAVDFTTNVFTIGPRIVVESLRQLFG